MDDPKGSILIGRLPSPSPLTPPLASLSLPLSAPTWQIVVDFDLGKRRRGGERGGEDRTQKYYGVAGGGRGDAGKSGREEDRTREVEMTEPGGGA